MDSSSSSAAGKRKVNCNPIVEVYDPVTKQTWYEDTELQSLVILREAVTEEFSYSRRLEDGLCCRSETEDFVVVDEEEEVVEKKRPSRGGRNRSGYVNILLDGVENVAQWRALKAGKGVFEEEGLGSDPCMSESVGRRRRQFNPLLRPVENLHQWRMAVEEEQINFIASYF